MKVERTAWWQYIISAICGSVVGVILEKLDSITGVTLIGTPWIVSAVLLVVGVVIVAMAYQVHKYATSDIHRRNPNFDPKFAVLVLVLAKTLGLSGALLFGWYVSQLLLVLSHASIAFFQHIIVQCALASIVGISNCLLGALSEYWCQLPPEDGAENPRMKKRRLLRERSVEGFAQSEHTSFRSVRRHRK